MSRALLLCGLSLVLTGAFAPSRADVPDPANCTTSLDSTQRLLIIPDGLGDVTACSFSVTVRNAVNNVINNALVEILVGGLATNHTHLCFGQVLEAPTNASGMAVFNIGGGGCYIGPNGVVIRVNGVMIRSFDRTLSPDYNAYDDNGIPGRWNLRVDAVDLAAFVQAYQGGIGPPGCQDYDNSGSVSSPDLAIFAQAYKGGANFCLPP